MKRKQKQVALRPGSRSAASIEACERRLLMSTYTVNTLSDAVNPVVGQLTLRQAVADANAHAGSDTIAFVTTVFAPGSLHTITLQQGELTLTDNTTIQGPGSSVLAIDGNKAGRVFQISSGVTVAMSGLTITDGSVTGIQPSLGGGVLNAGILNLTNVAVSNNTVYGGSGTGYNSSGGGIYSTGTLTLTNSVISGNTAVGGSKTYAVGGSGTAGGVYSSGPLTITGGNISGNTAYGGHESNYNIDGDGGPAQGGGIYDTSSLTLSSTTVTGNVAHGGPGTQSPAAEELGSPAEGGGIWISGSSSLSNDTITNNSADGGSSGGGAGQAGAALGGAIYSTASMSISSSSLSGNEAEGGNGPFDDSGPGGNAYGGAVLAHGALALSSTTVSNNAANGGSGQPLGDQGTGASAYGGGINSSYSLTVASSTISGNTALASQGGPGGGTYDGNGGVAQGGGIITGGTAYITSSTVSENTVTGGAGQKPYSDGTGGSGGVGDGGGVCNNGMLTITNSTFNGNAANGGAGGRGGYDGGNGGNGADGGGGAIFSFGTLSLYDSTVSGNKASGGAGGSPYGNGENNYSAGDTGNSPGGGVDIVSGNALFDNTIISANTVTGSIENDIQGTANASSVSNLIGSGSGGLSNGVNGNIVGVDNPLLSPLGHYGGPTQTMLPLYNSPVVNAGSNSLIPSGVTADQRGYSRISGSKVDMGADELQSATVSGTVFNDLNGDGVRETGEPGLADVTVYADLSNTSVYQSGDPMAVTDSNGNYVLNGVPEGMVIIRQKLPNGYRQSYPAGGGDHITVTPAGVSGAMFGDSTRLYVSGTVTYNGVGQGGVLVYADLNNDGIYESGENNKTTESDGTFAFVSLEPGTYTFRVVAPAGEVVSGNVAMTATLGSGGVDQSLTFTLSPQSTVVPLTGTIIGTSGSFQNKGNTKANAFDGNLNTYFDAPTSSGSWVGLDLGTPTVIQGINYAPRSGWASRMFGGEFQGSNTADFSSGVATLFIINNVPSYGLTGVGFDNLNAYRYVRYIGPTGGYCNIAELQFLGVPLKGFATIQFGGQLFVAGTPGSDKIDVNYTDGGAGALFSITTNINGYKQSFSNVPLAGVLIATGDGNDTLTVEGVDDNTTADVEMGIYITTGSGNDNVTTNIGAQNMANGDALFINTGDGNDSVDAIYNGQATINGGNGNNTLTAESSYTELPAYATIYGGNGNDTITAGVGGNAFVTAYGQGGNDTFSIDDYDDTLTAIGGTGVNTFSMTDYDTAESSKLIALDGQQHGNLLLGTDIQNVAADFDGNLTVDANSTSNDDIEVLDQEGIVSLVGGGGNDTLSADAGDSTLAGATAYLQGGSGSSLLIPGTGVNHFSNGTGVATADFANSTANLQIYLDGSQNSGDPNAMAYDYVNNKYVSGLFDTFDGTVQNAIGGSGNDLIEGTSGNNVLNGGNGNDTLVSNGGTDALFGGGGDDTFEARDGSSTYIDGGSGNNIAYTDLSDITFNVQSRNPDLTAPVQFTGVIFGTPSSYQNDGNTIAKVFDGNLVTYFDAPSASGSFVAVDLGSAKVVNQISFAPRTGWESRMVGGIIQGSNLASFGGAVTLYTINFTPASGALTTVGFTNSTAYRYIRYVGPNNSFCNIAELQLFGS